MTFALLLAAPVYAVDPFALEGTQPGELAIPLEPVENCEDCHAGWSDSPMDAWEGTMMANAFRDPLFLAALSIAEQDIPDSGNFCLRCHTPNGWLEGRCIPGDGSRLTDDDIDAGVGCDVCHRMVDEGHAGNAQYTISDSPSKRGMIGSEVAVHDTVQDPYLMDGNLCGVCHEVSNPALNDFPIELTWTEWSSSAFAREGVSCQDCHMKQARGYAANVANTPERDIHVHVFAGSNTWIPQVLAGEYPELGREEAFQQVIEAGRQLHEESARLEVRPPDVVRAGAEVDLVIRAENLTGHKLPTGYPEGRRAWLEVHVTDANGVVLLASGVYDHADADLVVDEQARIYQALLGSNGQQNYHMVFQDQLLEDTRIPPRGFVVNDVTKPIGRTYPTQGDGTMVNWDDAPYAVQVPADAAGPLTVRATLWYQTTTKAFVTFLRDENYTDDRGQEMYRMWEQYGKSPPEELASVEAVLELAPPVVLDESPPELRRGCGCATPGPSAAGALLVTALTGLLARRR